MAPARRELEPGRPGLAAHGVEQRQPVGYVSCVGVRRRDCRRRRRDDHPHDTDRDDGDPHNDRPVGDDRPVGGDRPTTSTTGTPPPNSRPSPFLRWTWGPQISGTTTQGHRLTTTNGTWTGSPTSFVYEWQDCNSTGGSCSSISGATSASYILTANDVGDTIRVVVTATNSGGSTPATSTATATATSSGGGTSNTNCLGTIGSGQVNYSSLDGCGYPSPNTTGVPAGTTLTAVSSISCTNKTIDAESTSGSVTIGSNCTITDSRLTGGQITCRAGSRTSRSVTTRSPARTPGRPRRRAARIRAAAGRRPMSWQRVPRRR